MPAEAGRRVRMGDRWLGAGEPVFVIAEIGLNHNGELGLALELIDLAAEAGADAVKFQKREVELCFTRAALDAPYPGRNRFGATYGAHKHALELSPKDYDVLRARSAERGVVFLVTPFDRVSADLVETLGCPAVKIASHNLTNLPLLDHVALTRRPILLSTGMADMSEVEAAVATIRRHQDELVLLQCTSSYPASVDELHLGVLTTYRERFRCPVGYSAHETVDATLHAAVALGACVIEKHFTRDKSLRGPDHAASFDPAELARDPRHPRGLRRAGRDHEGRHGGRVEEPREASPLARHRGRHRGRGHDRARDAHHQGARHGPPAGAHGRGRRPARARGHPRRHDAHRGSPRVKRGRDVTRRARKIRLLVLDVDGVLTDGRMVISERGDELKFFHTHDGMGVNLARRSGIAVALVTGEKSTIAQARGAKLGIEDVVLGARRKGEVLESLTAKYDVRADEVAFMGDDLLDIPALQRAGLAVAPANAVTEARAVAHVVTRAR